MAYIPKNNDEDNQSGMNVLGNQGQTQQNQQSEQQNQPVNVSGGQSATVGSSSGQNASQGQSQAPKGPPKKASSGMFTNIRKYINQNKPGAQRMAGRLQQNVASQNQNIQSAIQKQKSDFQSRVEQNRQRMQQAQKFGQQTLNQAQQQQSQEQLQQQQQDLQQRVGQFDPNLQNQQPMLQQTQGQIDTQQQALQQAQQNYQQQQQALQQQAQSLAGMTGQIVSDRPQYGSARSGADLGTLTRVSRPDYYTQEEIQQGLLSGDQKFINAIDQSLEADRQYLENAYQNNYQGYNEAQERLNAFQEYRNTLEQQNLAQKTQGQAQSQLESLQDQYSRAQEQQRLFENKQQLQNELAGIEEKIANAPEALTQDDIDRFNNLRQGVERFDNAILNLSEQQRQVDELGEQVDALSTAQGRRGLMRQEFGRQGGYTSGQAALDNLILTGDPQAMRDLVQTSQAQAQQAQGQLEQAFREGRITQDEMTRGTRDIQRQLSEGVTQAQDALRQGLEQRAETGEGTYMNDLRQRIQSGAGLTAQDREILGLTGQERYNVDPATLLENIESPEYSIQDVANLTDVARAQALARLSGQDQQTMLTNEADIRARNLRGEGDTATTQFGELSNADRESVMQFKDELRSGRKYASNQEAVQDIKKQVSRAEPALRGFEDFIYNLASKGTVNTNYGPVKLEDALAGDQQAAAKLQDVIYWSGGPANLYNEVISATKSAYDKLKAVGDVYGGTQDNALRGEAESAYVDQDAMRKRLGLS